MASNWEWKPFTRLVVGAMPWDLAHLCKECFHQVLIHQVCLPEPCQQQLYRHAVTVSIRKGVRRRPTGLLSRGKHLPQMMAMPRNMGLARKAWHLLRTFRRMVTTLSRMYINNQSQVWTTVERTKQVRLALERTNLPRSP